MEQQRTNFAPALLAAFLLHLGLLAAGLIAWPWLSKPIPPGAVTSVTLVAAAPAPLSPAEQAPEPAPATAPEPSPTPVQPPPAPAPTPAPTPPPKPAPTPKPAPPEPPKPQAKASKSAKDDSFLSTLTSSLDKQAAKADAHRGPGAKGALRAEQADAARQDQGAAEAATVDAENAVGARLNRIWNKRCDVEGFRNLEDIHVQFHLSPDGDLQGAPQVTSAERSDPVWRAAAEAAVRAVYQAQPFRDLPKQTYSQWRTFTANYQAKEACK
jgi:outer membrane biosynthesis protein TonB